MNPEPLPRLPLLLPASLLLGALLTTGCVSAPHRFPSEAYRPASSLVPASEFAARRARLMDLIPEGVAVLPGATEPVASVQFRQNNDFYYLTGLEVPGAYLVVDGVARQSALYFDLSEDAAKGAGLPLELVRDPVAATGVDQVRPVAELESQLAALQARTPVLYAPHFTQELARVTAALEEQNTWNRTVTNNPWDGRPTRQQAFVARLAERYPAAELRDCSPLLWQLRKIKSEAEVALIRRAAQIAVDAHRALIRSTEPGVHEQELAALFAFVCQKEGAQELAYATILMAGPQHPYGHYHRHDRTLEDGDFVILDAGPDYGYYDADVSSSFPVNGRFSDRQRELYELGEALHQVCLAGYRPGRTLREVGGDVAAFLEARGLDPAAPRFRGLTTWGGYNHPIGLATHDVMASMRGPDEPLRPGFVFACDINIPQDEDFGIRIEDTVVITADGCEVLSAGLPRTVAEIEALMRERGLLQWMDGR
ncbi:MAG: aminopeptidase P family protein [Planctomycetes bacterium]|nr:aminopeptidase P family protein [Planctomycetota bacterium]